MNPLLYVVSALSLGAIAVTVHALLSAPDGFEDEEGVHAVRPSGRPQQQGASVGTNAEPHRRRVMVR